MDVAKLMRLQSMLGAVLGEVRLVAAEDPASPRVAEATRCTVVEAGSALSDADLRELGSLIGDLHGPLTIGESRVIDAQLLGWLDGLALEHHWEGVRSAIDEDLARARDARARAAFEAQRRARGVL